MRALNCGALGSSCSNDSTTLQPELTQHMSTQEKLLFQPFDLSRLALFDHERFRRRIAEWRLRSETKRRHACVECMHLRGFCGLSLAARWSHFFIAASVVPTSFERNTRRTDFRESVPIFALAANPTDLERDSTFTQLRAVRARVSWRYRLSGCVASLIDTDGYPCGLLLACLVCGETESARRAES